jgi:uncharacterized protein (TIGR03083 family)
VHEQTGSRGDHGHYCSAVEAEVARFVEAVEFADPATPVPTCPGWTIAELVKHHGTTHRWIEYILRHRAKKRVWSRDVELGLPADQTRYPEWLALTAASLVAMLRATDPAAPIWTWGVDQHVRFWSRRVLYEAVLHRADAELALGHKPRINPDIAVDGIDEFLTNVSHARWVDKRLRELDGHGETLHLHSTDTGGEWLINLGRKGFTWAPGHANATVTVGAPAGDLLLLVYGRLPVDERFAVSGDHGVLRRWLDKVAF